jgi:hypothetical protein
MVSPLTGGPWFLLRISEVSSSHKRTRLPNEVDALVSETVASG